MAKIDTDIAQKIDIIVREANTATINLNITDENNNPYDITNHTCIFNIKDKDSNSIITIYNNITSDFGNITDGAGNTQLTSNGKIVIFLNTVATNRIPGSYRYKIKLISPGGNDNRTWMYGNFKINQDV